MHKVGIITYYGDNYGGCLQAYAMQTLVQQFGCVPHLIRNNHFQKSNTFNNKIKHIFEVLLHPVDFICRQKYVNILRKGEVIRCAKFDSFRKKKMIFSPFPELTLYNWHSSKIEGYDTFVCGSDQIWNPNLYPVDPIYFMRFVNNGAKKVAYAPSVGVSTIDYKFDAQIKEDLSDYHYISVREDDGANAIANIIGKHVDSVLDPTLLLNSKDWAKITGENNYGNYIFCYLFSESPFFDECKKYIKEKTGLKVLTLPYSLRELKSKDQLVFDAGPEDFVTLIEHAKLVLTDSFHATAFSVNLSTPFLTLERHKAGEKKSMNSRIYTILKKVNLENRLISNKVQLESFDLLKMLNVDFSEPTKLLQKLREQDRLRFSNAIVNE